MAQESGNHSLFRGALLGGFNRRDVAQYIEQSAKKHREQVEELQAQLAKTEEERQALSDELEGMRSRSGDLAQQEAQVRASLEESTRSLTHLRGELQVTTGQLTIAKKQLGDLQAKVAELEPMAQRYEGLKDRVATVELDAHQKAQATIAEAEAQAEAIRRDAARWLSELSGVYQALRDGVCACAQRVQETGRAFAEGDAVFQALLDRVKPEQTEEEQP